MRKRANFSRIFCIFAAICILFTSCNANTDSIITEADSITVSKNAGNNYHTASVSPVSVSKSSFAQLVFDKNTYSVGVRDLSTDILWQTLPSASNDFASVFEITLYTKKGIFLLNTQDNSVALNTASYETDDGKITIHYILSDSAATAEKSAEELTSDDIYVSFSVVFSLSEQSMTVTLDTADIKCAPNTFVSDIAVMPYFGSYTNSHESDYLFIPDASGAIMNTAVSDAATDNVTVKMYGNDSFTSDHTDCAYGTVPVFGIKHGNNAFAAVITDGDALASIRANRQNEDKPASVSASFCIRPVCKSENAKTIFGKAYDGNITVVYKFLSGESANYTAMASCAREELIANGVMSSSKAATYDKVPLFITLAGSDNGNALTTANQAIDILSILRDKGIDSIQLRCMGFLSGGIAQKNLYSSSVLSALGGKNGLQTLYNYTSGQNNTLMLDINLFSSSAKYPHDMRAKMLAGNNLAGTVANPLGYKENTSNRMLSRIGKSASDEGKAQTNSSLYTSPTSYTVNLAALSTITNKFNSFISGKYTLMTDGYSVNDAGKYLYSDNQTNRQEAKQLISELLRSIPAYGELSVDGGNIYTVYGAKTVTNMEFNTYYPESDAYEPVPFAQSVLHGYKLYTGTAIDAGDPLYRYDMLRQIEYGALPSFLWVNDASSVFCYSGYTSSDRTEQIIRFYNDAAEMLSSLTNETIVAHEKITKDSAGNDISGLYRTSYSDGTDVYVNYSGNTITTPKNIVVGAYSYVKVTQ